MKALFIESAFFSKKRSDYLSDDEFRELQTILLDNPLCGDVIQHTGGLRKMRFYDSKRHKGKRGGSRVIYYWYQSKSQFLLASIYGKDIADDLTKSQSDELSKMLVFFKKENNNGRR